MPAATVLDKLEADLLRIASDAGAAMPDGLDASVAARRAIRARWTAPRIRLDRERLKEACYARFDGSYPSAADLPALREAIAAFIDEVVAEEIHIQLTDPELTCA